jgi:hypothetical protein
MYKKSIWALALLFFCFSSCKEEVNKPNVDNIKVDLQLIRFDKELFAIDTNDMKGSLAKLSIKYPAFYKLYFESVLPLNADSSNFNQILKGFLADGQIRKLYDTTQLVMKDMSLVQKDMKEAFQFAKYYFPDFKEPNIYSFISEYGLQRFIFQDGNKDGIGIGLDLFLGGNYPYKKFDPTNPNFSNYLTRTFNQDHIVPKTMELIADGMIGEPAGSKMLDIMVHNGKKLYLKKLFLPSKNDTLIFEYTPTQMKWVQENELEMWSYFMEQNLVYESIPTKIGKYINPSPTSPGMPAEAPGNTANYIGLKIVEAYMKKFPNTTFDQLLAMNNAQKMMELANYKPRRK